MRKFLVAVVFLALSGLAAKAQTPRLELFTGLSYGQFNPGGLLIGAANGTGAGGLGRHFSMPGIEMTPQLNFSRWFGVIADVSAYGGTADIDSFATHARFYNYLVGPQLTARHAGPFNVFVRGLVGITHARTQATGAGPTPGSPSPITTRNRIAYGVGGGIDLNASKHIALRLIQIDFLRNSFTNCNQALPTDFLSCQQGTKPGQQNNFRAAVGLEWRF